MHMCTNLYFYVYKIEFLYNFELKCCASIHFDFTLKNLSLDLDISFDDDKHTHKVFFLYCWIIDVKSFKYLPKCMKSWILIIIFVFVSNNIF